MPKPKKTHLDPPLVRVALTSGVAVDHFGVRHEFPDCNRIGLLVTPEAAKLWYEAGGAIPWNEHMVD